MADHKFSAHLAQLGLHMNAAKCATLSIRGLPSRKSWVFEQRLSFKLKSGLIPAMAVTNTYKYHGVMMFASSVLPNVEEKMKRQLTELNRVPLKPQQRLRILRTKVIPAIFHQLVLADPTHGFLASGQPRPLDLERRMSLDLSPQGYPDRRLLR